MKVRVFTLVLLLFAMMSAGQALKDPICGQPHSQDGDGFTTCRGRFESYSYVADSKECVSFIYGGCGGNDNRFASKDLCEEKCKE